MLGDNKISFTLTQNSKSQNQIKNINIIQYYVWGLVEKKELKI